MQMEHALHPQAQLSLLHFVTASAWQCLPRPPSSAPELHRLEEGDDLLLPEDALVLFAQVGEGVGGLAVIDVGQTCLHT